MGNRLRFGLAVSGLTALIGANFTVAMSLDSGDPPPIRHGVSDLMANPGWTLATYQLFPWWLSEEFESVVVLNGGLADGQPGIRFADTNVLFPQVTVDTGSAPLEIIGDRDKVLRELQPYMKTLPDQTIWCQPEPSIPQQLCTGILAWEKSLVTDSNADFVVINLGSATMAIVEATLLDTLGLPANLTEPNRPEVVSQ